MTTDPPPRPSLRPRPLTSPPQNLFFPSSQHLQRPSSFPPRPLITYSHARAPFIYVADPSSVHHFRAPTTPTLVHHHPSTHPPRQVVAATNPVAPPPPPPQFVVPRAVAPSVSVRTAPPVASQIKIASLPSMSLGSEYKNSKERENSRDGNVATIHGRKVRIVEGGSNSLYSLCRSWLRNGVNLESQPNFGDSIRLLPRPLPASMVAQTPELAEKDTETEDPPEEELGGSAEDLSLHDLLEEHIKRAKRVRTRLRKERLLRIERYKQRLSLLLPPPTEMAKTDTPGN